MAKVTPGATCLIIGAAFGPKGPSVGRKCKAISLYPYEHTLHGAIWRCASVDGKEFISEHGGMGMEADFAEDWLQVEDPEQLSKDAVTEKELVVS